MHCLCASDVPATQFSHKLTSVLISESAQSATDNILIWIYREYRLMVSGALHDIHNDAIDCFDGCLETLSTGRLKWWCKVVVEPRNSSVTYVPLGQPQSNLIAAMKVRINY